MLHINIMESFDYAEWEFRRHIIDQHIKVLTAQFELDQASHPFFWKNNPQMKAATITKLTGQLEIERCLYDTVVKNLEYYLANKNKPCPDYTPPKRGRPYVSKTVTLQ